MPVPWPCAACRRLVVRVHHLAAIQREAAATDAIGQSALQAFELSYSLVDAVGIPLGGRLSAFFGARTIFTLGLLAFAVGCLIAALAPTFPLLIAGLIVQASGGAALATLALVVISRVFPVKERGSALGVVGAMVGAGQAVGPIAGGTIGEIFGWRGLFVGPMVLMLLLIPIARRILPNDTATDERRFDILGGLLLGLGAGSALTGKARCPLCP